MGNKNEEQIMKEMETLMKNKKKFHKDPEE